MRPEQKSSATGFRRYLFVVAALLLLVSIFLPYWKMTLLAPQYPGGLHVIAYVNELTGDVAEIDGLNHYIGMRPLNEAAKFERSVSIFAIGALALLTLAAIFVQHQVGDPAGAAGDPDAGHLSGRFVVLAA